LGSLKQQKDKGLAESWGQLENYFSIEDENN
jgi:hypothetical protein